MLKLKLALQGPKRPRQEDRQVQHMITLSLPKRLVSPVQTLNKSPFIRGFQDNVTRWMSNLINQQDRCLRMVAQQSTRGKLRQEQLAQTDAHSTTTPSQNDQV